jgi:transposase InsO family protein
MRFWTALTSSVAEMQTLSGDKVTFAASLVVKAVAARGLPTRLYMDNAKIYRSPQLARIAASIGILIVHTPPYQPEGRGKIERFFRSVDQRLSTMPYLSRDKPGHDLVPVVSSSWLRSTPKCCSRWSS